MQPNVVSIAAAAAPPQGPPPQPPKNKRRSALIPVTKKVRWQIVCAWLQGTPEECIADTLEIKRPIVEIVIREELIERYPYLVRNMEVRRVA